MPITQRTIGNAILYVIYRILAIVNNSCWYYFAPFVFNQAAFFYLINQKGILRELAEGGGEGGDRILM